MTETLPTPTVVAHPHVVSSSSQDESIGLVSRVNDPVLHVSVLAVHHQGGWLSLNRHFIQQPLNPIDAEKVPV